MRTYGEALLSRTSTGAWAGPHRAECKPSPFVGANLFALSGDNFGVEPRFQKDEEYFCFARRVGHGDRGDVVGKNRGVIWPVH
jgi:hypothetical protein